MGISVLMSIYKKEKPEYFRETMESILAQTRQPEEIVLIEDGTLTPELDAVKMCIRDRGYTVECLFQKNE